MFHEKVVVASSADSSNGIEHCHQPNGQKVSNVKPCMLKSSRSPIVSTSRRSEISLRDTVLFRAYSGAGLLRAGNLRAVNAFAGRRIAVHAFTMILRRSKVVKAQMLMLTRRYMVFIFSVHARNAFFR